MSGHVLAPGRALALEVGAGTALEISQVGGAQWVGLVAYLADDPRERLSMFTSQAVNGTWQLTAGHALVATDALDLLAFEADTSGRHHSGGGCCGPAGMRRRFGVEGPATCEDLFAEVLAPHGLGRADLDPDVVLNLFEFVAHHADTTWTVEPPGAADGDAVVLRATRDQVVAVANCPRALSFPGPAHREVVIRAT